MKIDAVITWVDSSDVVWRNKINEYLEKKIDWNNKKESTRFNSINEIEITILSILKFATFIKDIYLVTDSQQPENFLKLKNKAISLGVTLKVIDHKEIFKGHEECLPTFNSRSIASMLHKITNLSERFVIFNDDTFLINKISPDTFFKKDKVVVIGQWDSFYENKIFREFFYKIKNLIKNKPRKKGYKYSQQQGAKLLGFKKYIKRDHTPIPILKSVLNNFFEDNKELLNRNIKYKFRNEKQFLITSLFNHLAIDLNKFYLQKDKKLFYLQSYNYLKVRCKFFFTNTNKKKFMCLQSLEVANLKSLRFILKWIDKKLNSNFAEEL